MVMMTMMMKKKKKQETSSHIIQYLQNADQKCNIH